MASRVLFTGRTIRTHKAASATRSRSTLKGLVATGFVGVALSCLVPGFFASSAQANDYDVWSCRGPAGQALSMAAWSVQTNDAVPGDVWMTNDCLIGGPAGLHVSDSGTPGRKARVDLRFDLPRDAEISAYSLNRAMTAAGATSGYAYAAAVRETDSGVTYDQGCASYLALPNFDCGILGSHSNPADPANSYQRTGLDLDGLGVWAGCVLSGCSAPFMPPSARFSLFQSVVTIVDNDPPDLIRVGGAIARPDPVRGVADLYVDAADTNAGVRSMSLSIDGVPAQTIVIDTSPTCVEPFEVPRPCPAETGQIFSVNTDLLSNGMHVADGQVTDAAGNSTLFGPVSFTVSRDPDPVAPDNGSPAVSDAILQVDKSLVEHAPGKPAAVTGRLVTANGLPVSGARLEVKSTSLGNLITRERPLEAVYTGTDGRFVVTDRALGARRLTVSFSPVVGGTVGHTVDATVRSKLSIKLKAKPGKVRIGRNVRFTGRILGGGSTVAGANTEIQAISDGGWQTVANVSAKKNGKFVWKYRFRHVQRNAVFSFRAVVRGAPGWPWSMVKSKKVKVRIKVPGT